MTIAALQQLKEWPTTLSSEQVEKTQHLLRAIHTGILDQLEAFEGRVQDSSGIH